LPSGLRFRQEGPRVYFEGAPAQEGPAEVVLWLTDGAGVVRQRSIHLSVYRKISFQSVPQLPAGSVGQAYSFQLRTNDVTTATRFFRTDGLLPSGIGIMKGEIFGTPVQTGYFQFVVRAVAYQEGIGFLEGNEAEQIFSMVVQGNPPPATCALWPSSFRPFSSLAYVAPRGFGSSPVVLLAGTLADPQTLVGGMPRLPVPQASDQYYCESVEMAPGLWATPALPTMAERYGDFHEYAGRLLDPVTFQGGPFPSGMVPFPGGIIPAVRLSSTYAWRVNGFDAPQTNLPGTLDAASYLPELALNSWATLFGKNLTVATRTWGDRDIINSRLPTELAQANLKLNDRFAAISYASPAQINFLVPAIDFDASLPFTYVSIGLRNELWQSSWDVKVRRVAPKCYLFEQGGRRYPAAVHSDGSLAAPDGMLPGARPARPEETLQLFCSGLGVTNPAAPEARLLTAPLPLANTEDFLVRIAGAVVPLQFVGLVAPGLYQVNVTVPNLPSGEYPIELEAEGRISPPGVVLAIQR
jgi:uncharacterized protein (TIGR03437 family)